MIENEAACPHNRPMQTRDLTPDTDSLHPDMRAIIGGPQLPTTLDVATMRHHAKASKAAWNAGAEVGLPVFWQNYPAAVDMRPAVRIGRDDIAPLVHIHGGGWSICDLETHKSIICDLHRATGRAVWAPHPRQAPEHRYPEPLDDIEAALRNVGSGGARPLVVSGDSAGANLTLAALLRARDEKRPLPVGKLILFYGCYRAVFDTASHLAFGQHYGLTTAKMRRFWQLYAPDGGPYADLSEAGFHDLPPVQIHVAACDPLASDSHWLHRRIRQDGGHADLVQWPGMAHGFLHYARDLRPARDCFATAARFIATKMCCDETGWNL